MRKKGLAVLLLILLAFSLTGCHLRHTWTEASCTAPKTCSECAVTEGEPLPHTYLDATCTEPKTCSVCGGTDGEPLGHAWENDDRDNVEECSRCGESRNAYNTQAYYETELQDELFSGYFAIHSYPFRDTPDMAYHTIHWVNGEDMAMDFSVVAPSDLLEQIGVMFDKCVMANENHLFLAGMELLEDADAGDGVGTGEGADTEADADTEEDADTGDADTEESVSHDPFIGTVTKITQRYGEEKSDTHEGYTLLLAGEDGKTAYRFSYIGLKEDSGEEISGILESIRLLPTDSFEALEVVALYPEGGQPSAEQSHAEQPNAITLLEVESIPSINLLCDTGYFTYEPLDEEDVDKVVELIRPTSINISIGNLSSGFSSGSGYIYKITPQYVYFLTVKHVAINKKEYNIMFFDDVSIPCHSLKYITPSLWYNWTALFRIETKDIPIDTLLKLKEIYINPDIYEEAGVGTNTLMYVENWKIGTSVEKYTSQITNMSFHDSDTVCGDGYTWVTDNTTNLTTNGREGKAGCSGTMLVDFNGNLIGTYEGWNSCMRYNCYHNIDYIQELWERRDELD